MRLGHLLNGALHGVLVGEAVWRLLGFGGAADEGHSQAVWTARAMALPLGRCMIAAIGAGIALFGVFQWHCTATRNKAERVNLTHARLRGVIIALGTFGFLARGVLFGVIGAFLIDAARRYDTANATGIGSARCAEAAGIWPLAAERDRGGIDLLRIVPDPESQTHRYLRCPTPKALACCANGSPIILMAA
jgi:hypothetical protein